MPRHAFLERPVSNTSQLVAQLASNKTVLDRYERHFAMSESELMAYFQTLTPGKLSETKARWVYLVREDGMIDMRSETLKAGTKVFVDPSGKPILVMSCGNPLVVPKNPVSLDSMPLNSSNSDLADIPVSPEAEASVPSPDLVEPTAAPIPEIASVPPTEVTQSAAQPILGSLGGAPAGLLAFLPLLGQSHGAGGRSVVPEPATFAVIAVGLAGLMARKRVR